MCSKIIDIPKWQKDLNIYNNIKSTFILEGNIHDLQAFVNVEKQFCNFYSLNEYIYRYLNDQGYDIIIFYNKIEGFHNYFSKHHVEKINEIITKKINDESDIIEVANVLKELIQNNEYTICIIFDLANTLTSSVDNLSENEMDFFSSILLVSKKRKQLFSRKNGDLLTNHIFLICDKSNDIPAWVYNNNPYIGIMHIAPASREYRKNFIYNNLKKLDESMDIRDLDENAEYISNISIGMSNLDLHGLFIIAKKNRNKISELPNIINKMKYGEEDSLWLKIDKKRIKDADTILSKRVKGQDGIIQKVKELLIRSTLKLSSDKINNKPKGVMFFAGPTGTGKTELAKAITELLFYDETNMIRFDMSEYSESHSDQKLFGAPPGYIGYETGGQLTNAIKNNPFSVLLFDEIDKASSTIMDKFLQILDDGRMTDGQGNTVYFSETLIIFTSNIGMQEKKRDVNGNVYINSLIDYDEPYEKICETIQNELKKYFKPEVLNRLGNNIFVFDFIRDESIELILNKLISEFVCSIRKTYDINIKYTDEFYVFLKNMSIKNINYGGRGIRNVVETYFINYVTQIIFDNCDLKEILISYENKITHKII